RLKVITNRILLNKIKNLEINNLLFEIYKSGLLVKI
ncbi:unnamed protein product, partial [marine sediment metagenome]